MTTKKKPDSKFSNQRFSQRSVPLCDQSQSVDYRQNSETCKNLMDHSAHIHKFSDDLSNIAELEEFLKESDYYINTVYTYRSYSKPLPMIPTEQEDQVKKKLYKQVFDILTPQINKIKGLMEFHDRLVKGFTKNLRLLVQPVEKKEPLWIDLIRYLNKLIDKFMVLDSLKDMKGQMKNDFARFRRAFSFVRGVLDNGGELMAEITAIYNFLNDPQHPYHVILYKLKEDVQSVAKRQELFAALMSQAVDDIKNGVYVTPNEKHGLYRCLLASMYLADGGDVNAFKTGKSIPTKEIRLLVRRLPIIPLFMDTKTTVALSLSLCEHWKNQNENDWVKKTHDRLYNLVNHRTRLQEEYIQYTADFVTVLHEIRASNTDIKEEEKDNKNNKNNNENKMSLHRRTFEVVLEGMKLIGSWTSKVKELVVFKSSNPVSDSEFKIKGGKKGPAQVYEQITRYNYDNDLKYAIVEIIGLIKGLSNLLLENESNLRPIIASYIHYCTQEFTHSTLIFPLWRSHKKKKGSLQDILLTMRLVISDSYDINTMRQDFQKDKEKHIKKMEKHKYPIRSVFPTKTQVLLLRRLLNEVYSNRSSHMQKSSFFSDKSLKKSEVSEFDYIFKLLNNVIYVANYSETIKECGDLSDLWYREFYLNMTGCIQFPIAMSLPWMLTDFAMNTPSLAPNVFFPLSIYNDCGEQALTVFHQQHIFDEIEAEVNLVFDQLIFTLYRKIFDYYKNKASSILLDKPFSRKMEAVRDKLGRQMKLNYARYGPIFQQKCVHILGRVVDIQSLLTEQLNNYIRENLDAIITRYESATITSVIEIAHLVKTLKLTVNMLRKELPGIDPFEDIISEINEDVTLGSFLKGRLFLTTYNQIFSGLLRKYTYNQLTQRFVSLERPKGSKRIEQSFLWGSRFTQVYQQIFKVTKGFFGIEHLHSIVELLGIDSMPLLIDELVKTVSHVIIRDISPYVTEILNALDPMRQQPAHYGVLGVFGYYDIVLQFIKSYPALREGVFTLLRESGNALCLVQLFDNVLSHESYYNNQIQSFYIGIEPAKLPDEVKEQSNFKYSSGAATVTRPKESAYISILKKTVQSLKKKQNNLKNKISFENEFQLFNSCINNAIKREEFLKVNSGGWLFSATLDYLYKLLEDTSLLKEWKGQKPKNGILDHENPKDFARFWSVATWIFLCPDFSPEEEEKQRNDGYVSDRAYFGDGWLWAGTTILFLTGLRHRYRLLDPTIYIDKLQRLYPVDLNKLSKKEIKKKEKKDKIKLDLKVEEYKPFVKGLLHGWKEMERNVDLIEAILKSHYEPIREPIDKFTPKWEN